MSSRPYPIPGFLNACIGVAQLGTVIGLLHVGARLEGMALAAAAVVFAVVMNSVYSIIHEAEHGMLFENRRLNDVAGAVMALLFPAPFHLIRQGHLGHHQRNRSDDEAFDFWFEGEHPTWKRLQLYGILTGFYWMIVALGGAVVLLAPRWLVRSRFEFDRPSAAFMDALNPAYWPLIRLEAALAIVFHALLLWSTGFRLFPYAVMYCAFGLSWSAMQYVHHFGTEREVLNGARNLWIGWPVDSIWLHHNLHLTHHRHPTIPWIHLPGVAKEERAAERGFLPWAYLKMWRGPQRASERVRNRYAGRVIR